LPGALAPVSKDPGPLGTGPLDTRESFRAGAKPTPTSKAPVSKDPGALATGALDVGACSVADEVPPAAKAPGPLGTEESFRYRF
jgi:hypothetical protein